MADCIYRGDQLRKQVASFGRWRIDVAPRRERGSGFKLDRGRWVIERTFAWVGRSRRLAKDFEATIASAEAWFLIAHIGLLVRRLARA